MSNEEIAKKIVRNATYSNDLFEFLVEALNSKDTDSNKAHACLVAMINERDAKIAELREALKLADSWMGVSTNVGEGDEGDLHVRNFVKAKGVVGRALNHHEGKE